MVITEAQAREMKEAAKPLMKFLCDNFHPHMYIILESNSIELCEGVSRIINNEFLKD